MATNRNFLCADAITNGPKMSNPYCANGDGWNIGWIDEGGRSIRGACFWNLLHVCTFWAASFLKVGQKKPARKIFQANALPPRCSLQSPSCTSSRACSASWGPKHLSKGTDYPFLYSSYLITVKRAALVFSLLDSEGVAGSSWSSKYFSMGVLQSSTVAMQCTPPSFSSTLGCCKTSMWINSPGVSRAKANFERASACWLRNLLIWISSKCSNLWVSSFTLCR